MIATFMSFEPSDFLTIAEQLISDPRYRNQAGFRTSVSRSYYAAFLVVRKKLEDLGVSVKQGYEQHQDVINMIMSKGHTNVGNKLRHLRDKRNDADYHLRANINEQLARECIKLSSIVISSGNILR